MRGWVMDLLRRMLKGVYGGITCLQPPKNANGWRKILFGDFRIVATRNIIENISPARSGTKKRPRWDIDRAI
jgi:hypothetical protein